MFRSALAFSSPAAARSLKDLSPRPPTSYARPTLTVFLVGVELPDVDAPPPGAFVLLPLLLLPHAVSSSAMATSPAVIARPYLRRNAITSPVCPDSLGRPNAQQGDR